MPSTTEDILLELVRAASGISIGGTPVRLVDTRLNRAIIEAEAYFKVRGVPTNEPRCREPIREPVSCKET